MISLGSVHPIERMHRAPGRNSQVCNTDVSPRLATVLIILGLDVDELVVHAATRLLDHICERRERLVRRDDTVVARARVILDLLHEEDVGGVQVVDDVLRNLRDVV